MIQDGNYEDFAVSTVRRFAVEFYTEDPNGPPPSTLARRLVRHLGEDRYEINAQVAFAGRDLLMLDFGLLAYREVHAPPLPGVLWRTGTIHVGIDPFFYFEGHARRTGVPAAIYSWEITGIWRQTAPFVTSTLPSVGRAMVRDATKLGWLWQDATDAWADDDGNADYLIRARLRAEPPSRDI